MLELIFQGFWEWLYGLVLECWEYFSSSLLGIMSMDFAYLETHIPILATIEQSMLAIGWALLIGNLVFQASKSMLSGLGFEGENPTLLFTRTFVFSFLLLASPQICKLCLNMTSTIIEMLELPDAVQITFADNATFGGLACAWLLVILCGILVMFQSFKLIAEMAERYFILAMLTICAPLAFGVGGSRNTSDIFTGWCRMYGSVCLLMVLNVVFVKMLLSVLSFCPSGLDVLPWMVLVLTIVKVAKKADAIVTRIGLNPAMTGDSLGRSLPGTMTYLIARSAASQMTKAIGKSTASHQASHQHSATDTARGRAGGSYAGGGYAKAAAGKQTNAQSSAEQNTTAYTGGQQTNTQEQNMGINISSVHQAMSGSMAGGSIQGTKKTAASPSVQQATSHLSAAQSVVQQSQHGAAGMQTGNSITEKTAMLQSGTAGMGASSATSRFTRVDVQKVRQSAAINKSQTGIQNNTATNVSEAFHGADGAKLESPHETRFSQRPASTPYQGVLPNAASSGKGGAVQNGTAGKQPIVSANDSHAEARYRRNASSAPANGNIETKSFITARQESKQVTQAPKASLSASTFHHGTAGTAPAKQRMAQENRTAEKKTASAPTAARKTVFGTKSSTKQTERKNDVKRRSGNGK